METQRPKFNVFIGVLEIDLVDPTVEMALLIETIERMIPATKMRLIMELLGRTNEYQNFLSRGSERTHVEEN